MKTVCLFLIVAFVCSSVNAHSHEFLKKAEKKLEYDPLTNLNLYFDGIWGYFNYTQTVGYLCFNEVTAALYFKYLTAVYTLTQYSIAGNHALYDSEAQLLNGLALTLSTTILCMESSPDFVFLLTEIGFNDPTNYTGFALLENLYLEAQETFWWNAYTPVYNAYTNSEYKQAGNLYAPILIATATNGSASNINYNQLWATQNGIFFQVNLTAPTQLFTCYNEEDASYYMQFLYGWAVVASASNSATAYQAAETYFNGEGGAIFAKIPQSVFTCEDATQDQARLNAVIGVDIHTQQFDQDVMNYIQAYPNDYITYFVSILNFLNANDPRDAGVSYGQFLFEVGQYAINNTMTY